ncbi:hypothetical protein [uncultured Gammaproteobacteria bacterium]|jgi:uncharacterized protein YegP (UPF0339 family)|nr:hypothetical protein [uncultured Gammaproteobacteria bacterium]VVH60668.1 hypothetical protein BAZOLSSOX_1153 [uncultured Gammaproteobacteria bacterium]
MSNRKFEIHKNNDNQYWFGLKTVNGENIGKSKGYLVKQSAKKGIKSVRKNSQSLNNFTIKQSDRDNQWHFNLKSQDNGKVIFISKSYTSKQDAETGIESVKMNALKAPIGDLAPKIYKS